MHGRGCSHDMGAGRNFWVSRPHAHLCLFTTSTLSQITIPCHIHVYDPELVHL